MEWNNFGIRILVFVQNTTSERIWLHFEINKNVVTVSFSELLKLQIGAIKIVLLNWIVFD